MKNTSRLHIVIIPLAALFILISAQCWADDCYHVVSDAWGTSTEPLGQYTGTANVTMDGQVLVADVTATPTSYRGPTEDGTLHLETFTQFDFGAWGTIDTIETVVLSPTDELGIYRVNSRMIVVNGTGLFVGAYGKLMPHGYIDFNEPNFNVLAKGKVCQ